MRKDSLKVASSDTFSQQQVSVSECGRLTGVIKLMWDVSMLAAKAFRLLLFQPAASDWGWIMRFTTSEWPVGNVSVFLFVPADVLYVCMCVCVCTLTGSSVAEKASCKAQQANLHISSVNTGPTVTSTYLHRTKTNKG